MEQIINIFITPFKIYLYISCIIFFINPLKHSEFIKKGTSSYRYIIINYIIIFGTWMGIGCFLYYGFINILHWIPNNWGYYDEEYGYFNHYRSYLSVILSSILSGYLISSVIPGYFKYKREKDEDWEYEMLINCLEAISDDVSIDSYKGLLRHLALFLNQHPNSKYRISIEKHIKELQDNINRINKQL